MRSNKIFRVSVLALSVLGVGAWARPADARLQSGEHARVTTVDASAWTGVYRLTLQPKTGAPMVIRLIVERENGQLSGTFLTGDNSAAHADVRLDGDNLRASTVTTSGGGELILHATQDGVSGKLTVGNLVWDVTGTRSA